MERSTIRRVGERKESGEEARQLLCNLLLIQASWVLPCVNENVDKDLLKKKLKPPIRWMAAFMQASPWPRHPVSRQV